jgi:hypothetical protein
LAEKIAGKNHWKEEKIKKGKFIVHKKSNGEDSHKNQNDQGDFEVLEDKSLDFNHPHSQREISPPVLARLMAFEQRVTFIPSG